jgi:glycosyltransferase involved in cell wall biosynthesis
MGETFSIGDSNDLADALISIVDHPSKYKGDLDSIRQIFSSDSTAAAYEDLYRRIEKEL